VRNVKEIISLFGDKRREEKRRKISAEIRRESAGRS
jgi:hypothetical protein